MAASPRRRTLVLFGTLAAIQTVLFFLTFASTMHRFDTGEAATPIEQTVDVVAQLFAFPIVTATRLLPPRSFPGLWGWVPFVLNGLLWSALAVLVLEYRRRRTAAVTS